MEGQLIDEDNVIRAIREACGLSQKEAARVFGGGPKAFEKYESGAVGPSFAMTRLLLLAAKRPELFQKGSGVPIISEADATALREIVRKSSVERIYERIYNSSAENEQGPRSCASGTRDG